jgi:hypothetical protein
MPLSCPVTSGGRSPDPARTPPSRSTMRSAGSPPSTGGSRGGSKPRCPTRSPSTQPGGCRGVQGGMFHGLFEKARPTTSNGGANITLTLELIAFECPWVHDPLLCAPMYGASQFNASRRFMLLSEHSKVRCRKHAEEESGQKFSRKRRDGSGEVRRELVRSSCVDVGLFTTFHSSDQALQRNRRKSSGRRRPCPGRGPRPAREGGHFDDPACRGLGFCAA